jgi:hypothetical protein
MVFGLYVNSGDIYGYNVGSELLDGDLSKVRPVDETPDGGTQPGNSLLSFGRHVLTEHLPTRVRWKEDDGRPMPDFEGLYVLNVSERAKALIEQFEPGVHQFVPVDFCDKDNRFLEHRYFLFCGNRIDSLDHDKTTFVLKKYPKSSRWVNPRDLLRRGETDLIPAHIDPNATPKFVFSCAQIGGAHMWVDKYIDGSKWISDELAQAIKDGGFTGVKLGETGAETI